jgi:hypothetical protein
LPTTETARRSRNGKAPSPPVDELPPEGSEQEALEALERRPLRLPTYRLDRVHVAILNVDYAPPFGTGYARPLSEGRLRQLRREWDPLAVSPLTLSRRNDNTLWVIDGNHRRVVAYEKGMLQLPAMVHSGLERWQEADLYTKLGTVLGQTPWTRFQAKLAAMNDAAHDIVKIAGEYGLEITGLVYGDGRVRAVARVEWIYARGGPEALRWVFGFLTHAFDGAAESLNELPLEGVFGFYARYADRVDRDQVARMLGAAGLNAWTDRAASIWQRIDVGPRSNTYGHAIADLVNDTWRKQGKGVKQLLPAWTRNLGAFPKVTDVKFSSRMNWTSKPDHEPAPQQLNLPTP